MKRSKRGVLSMAWQPVVLSLRDAEHGNSDTLPRLWKGEALMAQDKLLKLLDKVRKSSVESPETLALLEALTERVVELTTAFNDHRHVGRASSGYDTDEPHGSVTVGVPVEILNHYNSRAMVVGKPVGQGEP